MKFAEQEPFPPIYVDSKKENEVSVWILEKPSLPYSD